MRTYSKCDVLLPAKIKLFMGIKDNLNVLRIKRSTGSNYSYAFDKMQEFEARGLITTKKEGRERKVKLTEKGRRLKAGLQIVLKEWEPVTDVRGE